jgi:hypothetical protein
MVSIGQSSAMPRPGGIGRINMRPQDIYLEAAPIVFARSPAPRSGRLYSAPAKFPWDR